jgi:hypothetical protein
MTRKSLIRFASLAAVALVASVVVAAPKSAQAAHTSYEYHGHVYGVHGEAHIITALKEMELSYDNHGHGGLHIQQAAAQLEAARREVSHARARYLLNQAQHYLNDFAQTGRLEYLDTAALMADKALHLEHSVHLRSATTVTTYHAPAVYHGTYPSYNVLRRPRVIVPATPLRTYPGRSRISVSGPYGGIRVGF